MLISASEDAVNDEAPPPPPTRPPLLLTVYSICIDWFRHRILSGPEYGAWASGWALEKRREGETSEES